jgi:small GTP-binding protein
LVGISKNQKSLISLPSFLLATIENCYPTEYVPTVVDNTEMIIVSNEVRYTASIWDTAGKDEYKRIRQLSYPKTDLFIVLFELTKVKEKMVS